MPTHDWYVLQILGEANEPLFPSQIAERLNREASTRFTMTEVAVFLEQCSQAAQTRDGRWTLKWRAGETH